MQFAVQVCLFLAVLFCGLMVFLNGSRAMIVATLLIALISAIKDLSLFLPGLVAAITLSSFILQSKVQKWVNENSKGALFPGLAGSLVILLFYGIFLGPISSFLAWLITSGLQLFPQLHVRVGRLNYWGNTILRAGLTLVTWCLGIYVVWR